MEAIKTSLKIIASVAAITVLFWGMEDRYLSASDFHTYQQQQINSLKSFRRQMLEDDLFDLEFKESKGTLSDLEKAKLKRIRRRLNELDK